MAALVPFYSTKSWSAACPDALGCCDFHAEKIEQVWDKLPMNPDTWVEIRGSEGELSWLKLGSLIVGKAKNVTATAAGPLAGFFGAVLGNVIARWSRKATWKQIGLAFSLASSLLAVLYYLRSPIRTGGLENPGYFPTENTLGNERQ